MNISKKICNNVLRWHAVICCQYANFFFVTSVILHMSHYNLTSKQRQIEYHHQKIQHYNIVFISSHNHLSYTYIIYTLTTLGIKIEIRQFMLNMYVYLSTRKMTPPHKIYNLLLIYAERLLFNIRPHFDRYGSGYNDKM